MIIQNSNDLQTRTTSFSCSVDNEDYDESLLISRSLPWVVRVYFKYENSMKGILCSGNIHQFKMNFKSNIIDF